MQHHCNNIFIVHNGSNSCHKTLNAFNIINDLTHFLNKENSWNIQNINKHILS